MNKTLLLISIFCFSIGFSQEKKVKKHTDYIQFEVSFPLKGNNNRNEFLADGTKNNNKNWFLPDGLSSKIGYGFHKNKWVSIGIHSGLDWIASSKIVIAPVFGNLKISPKLSKTNDNRLFLNAGYGKSFVIGRGGISGDYQKLGLGFQNNDDFSFFIEIVQYGLNFNEKNKLNTVNIGVSITTF